MSESLERQPEAPEFNFEAEFSDVYHRLLEKHPRSKQICICGHTVNTHHATDWGRFLCTPGNIICHCAKPDAYLSVTDARYFKRSTHGWGPKHALGMGIAALKRHGGQDNWFRKIECSIADCKETDITVACVDHAGQVVPRSTNRSLLICKSHVFGFGGSSLSLF